LENPDEHGQTEQKNRVGPQQIRLSKPYQVSKYFGSEQEGKVLPSEMPPSFSTISSKLEFYSYTVIVGAGSLDAADNRLQDE
jgi:hypothetical protein